MPRTLYSGVYLFKLGDVLDERYDIIGPLGQGGMAQVFRAHDRHLEREVALKVLRPHLTDMDRERFRREIKALAKLSHPGIVGIYDLGRGEHVYFAMELVEGGSITGLGPLEGDLEPLLAFLEAAIATAEALAYVHRRGMVHRDLTPRNILMTSQGQPKVMDFGLVQLAEASRQLTRTGFTLGTPQYMAPEQAQGDALGPHTDLYALGAVFYRTVTGQAPFEAENDQAILYHHVYSELQMPRMLNPSVPEALSTLISSLLAKNPAARPTSAERVAEALRDIRAEVEQASSAQRQGGPGQLGQLAHGPVNPNGLQRQWQTKLAKGPQWPAALTAAEGFLLLGLPSEEVCVLRPADGVVQSRFATDDEVDSAVVFAHRQLYFTSRGGSLYALAWPGGERRWLDEQAGAKGLLPYADDLLLTTAKGLERRSSAGERRWCYEADSEAVTAPLAHAGQGFFMTRSGWLHAVDLKTGSGKFKLELGYVLAQPSAKDGILLLPERAGELHAFDLKTLQVLWSYDMEGQLWASPVMWQQFVFAISWAGVLRCLSLKSGDDVWEYPVGSKVTASPILAGGTLYLASEAGDVLALDARSGAELFRDHLSVSPIQASPLAYDGRLFVASLDGMVQAYG